jgi:queuosine precursor transporter
MPATPTPALARRTFKYYDMLMAAFVTVLLCSNLIGPGKSCAINLGAKLVPHYSTESRLYWSGLLVFGAGNIFFPISYIFDDVLTEVYGYAKARKVIWAGFISMVFATLMGQVVIHLPVNPDEPYNKIIQPAVETCFGNTWRIVVASMVAFWAGDFANSYVLAKMKILTKGRWLWTRTIGSTIVGEGLDSLIFYPIAFAGLWTTDSLISVVVFNWLFKTAVEVVMTPATYAVVGFLKKAEHEDYYDVATDFNPFTLKD